MAGKLDLTCDFAIQQGADFQQVLTWENANGTAVNVTGYSALMQIRTSVGGEVLLELSTENGMIALGGSAGTITLHIDAETTAGLDFIKGVYDLQMISGSDFVTRLVEGVVALSPAVTVDE